MQDRIVVEKKREQEKLRLLGIERAKREEEQRLRKYVAPHCTIPHICC